MFQLGKTIVSEDIIEKDFMCNLSACKGACCVDGDAGAPLEKEEVEILKKIYPKIKPFLSQQGIDVIEKQGTSIVTKDDELETPLVNNADCAYVNFDEKEIALKKPEEVYIAIYKEARRKAKEAKRAAISAYLEMKRIKNKYLLEEMDSSDDEFKMPASI